MECETGSPAGRVLVSYPEEMNMVVMVAQSADEWEDIVSDCFVPLSCSGFGADFRGRMQHLRLDSTLSVSDVRTDGTSAERSERLAARALSDDLHLSLQVSSSGLVSQGGRSTRVRPGAVTTYATDAPYHLDYSRPDQHQVIIQVSRDSLRLPRGMIADSCRRLRVPASSSSRLRFSYATSLALEGQDIPAANLDEAGDVARDLAEIMIRSSYSAGRLVPRTETGLFLAIDDHLRTHATSRELTVEAVAAAFFISRRRLFQVFAARDTTPANRLRRMRLDRAAALLADPAGAERSISSIAYEVGFGETNTFTRAFRREYGDTPRDYRHRQTSQEGLAYS
jgi:AraC family transcriptional activator of tynA and feaB